MQNDDWVYYSMVENFLKGNLILDPISAPTFYTQGIIAALFSTVLEVHFLPVLTLLVSCSSFLVFYLILTKFIGKSRKTSILTSLLLFFNPLFVYSIWGFMTENYYLFFVLLSLYFYLSFIQGKSGKSFVLYAIFTFLALNVRQIALVFPVATLISSVFAKDRKLIKMNLTTLVFMCIYYFVIFPKTPEMAEKTLQLQHLLDFEYTYSLIYGSLILITSFLLPLYLLVLSGASRRKFPLIIIIGIISFLLLNKLFTPQKVSWGEYPYFENTFERKGFYPRGILGTKYHFKGIYDLYSNLDLISKIAFAGFISFMLLYVKKFKNIWSLYVVLYLGLMAVTETFYDRYLVGLLPFFILMLLSTTDTKVVTWNRHLIKIFLVFLIFFDYQFSLDFILTNKYVWTKSLELVSEEGVEPYEVQGTNAWKLMNRNPDRNYTYDFTFDSTEVNSVYKNEYSLVDTFHLEFPANLWVSPDIYLYKRL